MTWEFFLRFKYQSCNAQNRSSGEMANSLFDICTNTVMPHENHMFQTASDMAMAKMCAYTSSKYALPHWKCVLIFCAKFPYIDL